MTEITGYKIIEKMYEGSGKAYFRALKAKGVSKPLPVIIKAFIKEEPDVKETASLQKDFEITKDLSIEGIVKPYELVPHNDGLALILEAFDGEPLTSVLGSGKIEVAQFLRIAIELSEILGEIHGSGIIHRGLNPQNILINRATNQIKLTDFGNSTFFPGKRASSFPLVDTAEGALFYVSPEQTGRMNRVVDYRSDLYSLGVIFYEILTGGLPFQSESPLELVHFHIAKKPVPPHKRDRKIPEALSGIVMKLLSKAPEERYQSTHGLISDLKRCLLELESTGEISDFRPGEDDRSPIFRVSQRFYGREAEKDTLRESFHRAASGERVLALIAGKAGIGKTALVREFYQSFLRRKGLYTSCKFERLQRDIPYSGFRQAFKELIDKILMQSKDQVASWKETLLKSMGPNGRIIIDLIPQMALVIGQQKPVAELPPKESQIRFNNIFQSFLSVFIQNGQPLIVFFDDLHWADFASLQLLRYLMSVADLKHLLLLCAYRSDEIDSSHPLQQLLDELGESKSHVIQINLKPLSRVHVESIVSDTLKCKKEEAWSLAHLVYDKTRGNPFFVNEFMKTLYQKNHTSFNFNYGNWVWNLDEILKADITDDLIMLVTEKIRRLSKTGQRVLKLASCFGNNYTLAALAELNDKTPRVTFEELQESLLEGLVVPFDEENINIPLDQKECPEGSDLAYKFLHDRVQQVAYSLLTPKQKQHLHLRIGQFVYKGLANGQMNERICECADHLNRGRALIKDRTERYEFAELNLAAGKRAKASIAYESALRYLTAGIEMLPADSWQNNYELMLSLHVDGAEAAYLCSDFTLAEALNRSVLTKARTLLDRVKAYEIIIQSSIAQSKYKEAVDVASKVLNQLGVFLPKNPGRLRILLGLLRTKMVLHGISFDDLYTLPPMTDQYKLAAMRILMGVFNPFYTSIREMFPSIAFRMLILSLKYGNSDISPFAYALYGLLLGLIGEVVPGYQFGEFALKLFKRYYNQELTAKMYNVFYVLIKKWKAHLKEALEPLLEAYKKGLETGDSEWAAYAIRGYCIQLFFTGRNMEIVRQETAEYSEILKKIKQVNTLHNLMLIRQSALNMMGYAENTTALRGESFNEEEMLPVLTDAKDTDTIAGIRFHKCMLCYLFEDYLGAIKIFREVERHHETRGQFGFVLEARFYYSLVLLAVYPELKKSEQKGCLKIAASFQKMMKRGAECAPMNYLHKWHLVEAERERVMERDLKAMEHYDKAIRVARENDYVQDEALANELAAKFYLKREKRKIAETYMKEAHFCYKKWGANAKVRDLEQKYGDLIIPSLKEKEREKKDITLSHDTVGTIHENLDLATVLKASQVISGEIVLESLLERLMKMVIEVSGAERGVLILEEGGKYFVKAKGDTDTGKIRLLQNAEDTESGKMPHSVVNYVLGTKQNIVLGEAWEDDRFYNDAYITRNRIRSLLCAPIVHQGLIKGILYLENNLTGGVFTEERAEVVRLIASQAAISLENARLYRSLF
jgi:predicted ATPase/GAF domain-containing protein